MFSLLFANVFWKLTECGQEYMQLRYEYKRRHIPLDGAVAFSNIDKTNEGGGFLKIKVIANCILLLN
jgi:hypothetical protein